MKVVHKIQLVQEQCKGRKLEKYTIQTYGNSDIYCLYWKVLNNSDNKQNETINKKKQDTIL